MGIIYLLVDPRDTRICYVGETMKSLTTRMFEHMAAAFAGKPQSNEPKQAWLKELYQHGLLPEASVLEVIHETGDPVVDKSYRCHAEDRYVKALRTKGLIVMNADRAAALRKWQREKTPEERQIVGRKSASAITREQRSAFSRLGKAKQSIERKAEIGRKISATLQALSAEERSRRARDREDRRRSRKIFRLRPELVKAIWEAAECIR